MKNDREGIACPGCGALHFKGEKFCSECGASLLEDKAIERESATHQRGAISREITRSARRLEILRWFYGASALFSAVRTGFAISTLTQPDAELRFALLAIVLGTLSTAFQVAAWISIRRQPVLWSTLAAAFATMTVLLVWIGVLIQGASPKLALGAAIWSLWPAFLWWIVAAARRAARLAREHPELYAAQAFSIGELVHLPKSISAEERSERLAKMQASARRSALRRAGIAAGSIVLLSALASSIVYATLRPANLLPAITAFSEAWNREGSSELVGLASDSYREELTLRLANAGRARGWGKDWPDVAEFEAEHAEGKATGTFALGEDQVEVEWRLEENRWKLTRLVLPLPMLDACIEQFAKAWKASDAARVAQLFKEDSREKMQRSLERYAQREKWGASFPALEFDDAKQLGEARAEVAFTCEGGTLRTRWKLGPTDDWEMTGIVFPRD